MTKAILRQLPIGLICAVFVTGISAFAQPAAIPASALKVVSQFVSRTSLQYQVLQMEKVVKAAPSGEKTQAILNAARSMAKAGDDQADPYPYGTLLVMVAHPEIIPRLEHAFRYATKEDSAGIMELAQSVAKVEGKSPFLESVRRQLDLPTLRQNRSYTGAELRERLNVLFYGR